MKRLKVIVGLVAVAVPMSWISEAQTTPENGFTPFITPNTMYLDAPSTLLERVEDDVFWVMRGDFLSGERYEFWKVDGTKLSNAEWEKVFSDHPVFNSGVVPVRRPPQGYKQGNICLLYTDGRVKDLGVNWSNVTNFMDGVAVAVPTFSSSEAFYIDTTGKRIYPSIKVDGSSFNYIRPLRDGLRAYKAYRGEWGFIDGNGVVKLAPEYKEVSDFSEGYAWVRMADDSHHLIDTTGKSVFTAGDSNAEVSQVVNGLFYVKEGSNTCYYHVKGGKLDCFDSGNQFYGGYAFVTRPRDFGDVNSLLIDTEMNVVREIPWNMVDAADVSEGKPKFTASGLANINNHNIGGNSYLLRPNADVALAGYYSDSDVVMIINEFGPVSDCGYFVAKIAIEEGAWDRLSGKAIIRPSGEVVWIVSEDKGFDRQYDTKYPVRSDDLDAGGGMFNIRIVDPDQSPVGKR